jgi:hypothetical protein
LILTGLTDWLDLAWVTWLHFELNFPELKIIIEVKKIQDSWQDWLTGLIQLGWLTDWWTDTDDAATLHTAYCNCNFDWTDSDWLWFWWWW